MKNTEIKKFEKFAAVTSTTEDELRKIMREMYTLIANIESYQVVNQEPNLKEDVNKLDKRIQALNLHLRKENLI